MFAVSYSGIQRKWSEVEAELRKDPRGAPEGAAPRDLEDMFRKHTKELFEEKRKAFVGVLESAKDKIGLQTRWEKFADQIRDASPYRKLQDDDRKREFDLFVARKMDKAKAVSYRLSVSCVGS